MRQLPFVISNPHCGSHVPKSVREKSLLTPSQIAKDSDEDALEIYAPLESLCNSYLSATAARAFVDLNRCADDLTKDGVVKTHTCWDEPIYDEPLSQSRIDKLLDKYYYSYHEQLRHLVDSKKVSCLFDCHTMAEYPPPVAPDSDVKRPLVCLSDGDSQSCPSGLFDKIVAAFNRVFDGQVAVNRPFKGGYICRHYGQFLPTIQIELSRADEMSVMEKSDRVQAALAQVALL